MKCLESAKENLFAESDVLVAPSYVENFGMVIAEALAHEVPVIAGRRDTMERSSRLMDVVYGWRTMPRVWLPRFGTCRALPLREMGRRGRCWMQREFSWEAVSSQMLTLFHNSEIRIRAEG